MDKEQAESETMTILRRLCGRIADATESFEEAVNRFSALVDNAIADELPCVLGVSPYKLDEVH